MDNLYISSIQIGLTISYPYFILIGVYIYYNLITRGVLVLYFLVCKSNQRGIKKIGLVDLYASVNVIGLGRGYHGFPHSWLITEMPKYILFIKVYITLRTLCLPLILCYSTILLEYYDALNAKEKNKVDSKWDEFFVISLIFYYFRYFKMPLAMLS